MSVINANNDNFQSAVLDVQAKPVIVDFWAPWCGPCQMQGPILEELATEAGDTAVIVKVDVDSNNELAGKYGIMSIPALKVFKDGEVVEEMVGVHSKEQLMEIIKNHS